MATTYSWIISQLQCYPEQDNKQNVVFVVHWRRQASDGLYMAEVYGAQEVTLDPSAPFTPFAELTQAEVEGWLEDAMGAGEISEMDARLDAMLQTQINPPIVTPPLPWASNGVNLG